MFDAGADRRACRIAPPDVPGHGPATRLPAVDTGAMAPCLRPGPVPRRAVTGVRPDGSGAIGRVRFAPFGLPGPGISGCPAGVCVFPRRPGAYKVSHLYKRFRRFIGRTCGMDPYISIRGRPGGSPPPCGRVWQAAIRWPVACAGVRTGATRTAGPAPRRRRRRTP